MTEFKKGDKIQFTDKYGILQTGTYIEPGTIPDIRTKPAGEIQGHNVRAKVFQDIGSDDDVLCFVKDLTLLTECDHDFSGVGVATQYKGEYREKCRHCGNPGEVYEKDYT